MKFKTKLTESNFGRIGKVSFAQALLETICSRECDEKDVQIFEALLVASMDNGIEVPSIFVPRVVASTGNSMNASLAAGLLSIGDYHGGAAELCAVYLLSGRSASEIVSEIVKRGKRMPGYGHKVYKDSDPRVVAVYELASRLGKQGKYLDLARQIEVELNKQLGKVLPLNIDGVMAAVMCELGIDQRYGKAIFGLSRLPTMAAHVIEELTLDKPYRRLEASDVESV